MDSAVITVDICEGAELLLSIAEHIIHLWRENENSIGQCEWWEDFNFI